MLRKYWVTEVEVSRRVKGMYGRHWNDALLMSEILSNVKLPEQTTGRSFGARFWRSLKIMNDKYRNNYKKKKGNLSREIFM